MPGANIAAPSTDVAPSSGESRNDQHRDHVAADCFRVHDNVAGIGNDAGGIGDIAMKVIPC